jgi:hypothetical protein
METASPPNLQVLPRKFEYVRVFLREWCYMSIPPPQPDEIHRAINRKVYITLRGMKKAAREPPRMRIIITTPPADWPRV